MILFVKHIDSEGPGVIGEFFKSKEYETETIELFRGEAFPDDLRGVEAVITLGGPMNVYEEEKYPYLKDENIFIKKVMDDGIPFLGICLGAQLLAKAAGSSVKKAPVEEIGFYKLELTGAAEGDVLFLGLEKELEVFQWHGDTFDVPRGGELLATADKCRNQAFRVGKSSYGLQFHLEVTGPMIESWIEEYFEPGDSVLEQRGREMLTRYDKVKSGLEKNVIRLCRNFESLII